MENTFAPVVKAEEIELSGRTLSLETGRIAELAMGAVVVRYGDSIVLSTAVGEQQAREDAPFFPLTVDYEERMYAAGKIPGGFIKREGRPTEAATLAARLTDRPIRPLFPKGYRAEVQIISTVMSADQENDPDILSIIGASAALMLSPIPWDGPVGAVRMGLVGDRLIVNPTIEQLAESALDMVIAGTDDAIMMVEGEASQLSEAALVDAIETAHEAIKEITAAQRRLQAQAGSEKWSYDAPKPDEAMLAEIQKVLGGRLREAVNNPDKVVRLEGTDTLRDELLAELTASGEEESSPAYSARAIGAAFESLLKQEVRGGILRDGMRPDGRRPDEIRPIWCEVGYLPRAHGSAIFTRGQTQVVNVLTLGSTAEEQRLDSISPENRKRYIHHYNFPPFSVGEVRRMHGPGRRDIGHGALAERALLPVIPDVDTFPYTLRLVSEVVSSNGSTSMASVCGSTLSLMDAGVPIAAPVAGVAMGLITDPDSGEYTVLSDIQGMEDALGDMDFKVAGTAEGVTAIQMDIKVKGITPAIMREALEQARAGRLHILDKMLKAIPAIRPEMSPFAPRVLRVKVNPDKIGSIIGPGGKNIRALQEETGTKIDIEDDGTVSISSVDASGAEQAVQRITGMTQEFKIERGEIYTGKVVTVVPFGAFVEIMPGKDGLVHISELSEDPSIRVDRVEDVVNVGDEITVMVIEVAPNGKVSLSRRAALTGALPEPKAPRPPRREGSDRGFRPEGDRGRRPEGDRGPRPEGDFNAGGSRPMTPSPSPRDAGGFANRPADSRRRPNFPPRDDE